MTSGLRLCQAVFFMVKLLWKLRCDNLNGVGVKAIGFFVLALLAAAGVVAEPLVVETLPVDLVWSGHPVGFFLLTLDEHQFVAYYNAERQMTVGTRRLDEKVWQKVALPESLGWDSHNSIVLAPDRAGYLHLSGNMHGHPLKYFRTTQPLDITTFERVSAMTGQDEARVTYPEFLQGPDDALLFTYRDGRSGAGNQIYNVYDETSTSWRRLLDSPLTDGRGIMNAYFNGPLRGPDGYYHLAWVWRDTPDCETNHHVSYARSRDLLRWEKGNADPLSLPMTIDQSDIVDPVPPGGGVINGNVRIGFDAIGRTIVSYHKYDAQGHSQIYNARLEHGRWNIHQTSDWASRWEFQGPGSIIFEVKVSPVAYQDGLGLVQPFRNRFEGSGRWLLDPETLAPQDTLPLESRYPRGLAGVESDFPGMQVNWQEDAGTPVSGPRYVLRWETLAHNRDRPRDPPWPAPSALRLVVLED
jgi:hypothetical protein